MIEVLSLVTHGVFYLVAAFAIVVCILTANNMSSTTNPYMRNCMKLIIVGVMAQVWAIWYDLGSVWQALAGAPILAGIAGWLVFDRYHNNPELIAIADWFRFHCHLVRQWLQDKFRKVKS
jgi:hypothetical protein